MMDSRLTMQQYFNIINTNEYVFEAQDVYKKYVPKVLYKFYSIPDDNNEREKRFNQLKNEKIWMSRKQILNDPFELEHCILSSASPEAQKYYKEKIQELEFFCLTESPLNKLMWAHYANSYKGFCVAFSVGSPEVISPVIYDNSLPDLSEYYQRFFENRYNLIFSSLNKDECSKDALRLYYPLVSKDSCWSYEKEFRIVSCAPLDGKNGHLCSAKEFDLSISKIIVGAYCSKETISRLKEIVDCINQSRLNKQKQYILQSDKYSLSGEENLKMTAKTLWHYASPQYSEISIKKIAWNDKLELIERNLIEDEFDR